MSPVRGRRFRPSLGVVAVASIGIGQLAASAVAGSDRLAGSSAAVLVIVAAVVIFPVVSGALMWLDAAVVARERVRRSVRPAMGEAAVHELGAFADDAADGDAGHGADGATDASGSAAATCVPGRAAGVRVVVHPVHTAADEPRRRASADVGVRPATTAD